MDHAAAVAAWAHSGAMALTGRADAPPLGPPERLVPGAIALGEALRERSAVLGREVDLDVLALLGERAAIAGFTRAGDHSCGGATRLLATADGCVAVTLARADDFGSLPAWLGVAVVPDDPWPEVQYLARGKATVELVERACLLGLAVAAVGEAHPVPVTWSEFGDAPAQSIPELTVVDLTSLWAGPLCTNVLQLAGARVLKVESSTRPDGARLGPPEFFDLLHAGKESVALDLTTPEGRNALGRLVASADVVVEASRPRALAQLGIDAVAAVSSGPAVWVSLTGYGRTGAGANRVAFGDDVAAAGGLVVHDQRGLCFCGDAIADPLSGLTAAAACLDALARGGRWLLDVAMSGVAAAHAGHTLAAGEVTAAPPRARPPRGAGPALGAHTDQVLSELAG